MRKRGLNQRYEAHGLLRKTIGEKSPPYAQSPANGIYLPILKVYIRLKRTSRTSKLQKISLPGFYLQIQQAHTIGQKCPTLQLQLGLD